MSLLDDIHKIIGPLAQDDLIRLKQSIERDGVLSPVIIHKSSGEIIDGKHRASIAKDYPTQEMDVDEKEAARQAISLNLARRHLSNERKRELIKPLRAARFTQKEAGEMVGMTQGRISQAENVSNININNAYIPDLRIKLSEKQKNVIKRELKAKKKTHAQIAADFGISRVRVTQIKKKSDTEDAEKERLSGIPELTEKYRLITADIKDADVDDNSLDWVITDPPYPKKYLPLIDDLGEFCKKKLKDGGSLVCMMGQSYLPEVYAALEKHLTYWWTCAYLTPGDATRIWNRKIMTGWKPLLWYCKGEYSGGMVFDVFKSDVSDKEHHIWGQSVSGMADLIEKLTNPGETICDPFLGGGTTGVIAIEKNRYFIGIDIDEKAIETSKARFQGIEDDKA